MYAFADAPRAGVPTAAHTLTQNVAGTAGATAAAKPSTTVEEYAWEKAYDYTWEAVEEDASGLLRTDALERRRLQRCVASLPIIECAGSTLGMIAMCSAYDVRALSRVQRGMLRHVLLVLDMSRAMAISDDFKPSRAAATVELAKEFVTEYFDQNPISSLGVIVTRHSLAEKVTELSTNARVHLSALSRVSEDVGGDLTLQNSLDIAYKTLSLVPSYGTREVIVVHGSHSTVDPGNIFQTLQACTATHVRVSFIGLPGEMFIAARIAKDTGGTYVVPESRDEFRAALLAHCPPPPRPASEANAPVRMVPMGFPKVVWETPGICACHATVRAEGYICPRCASRVCDISTCVVCGLQLVSAQRLARSYHHLFPVEPFVAVPDAATEVPLPKSRDGGDALATHSRMDDGESESPMEDVDERTIVSSARHCHACLAPLAAAAPRYCCPRCLSAYCSACDVLIHETLHNCPGCV